MTDDNIPAYRFKDNVGYVLAQTPDGLKIIEIGRSHFIISGLGRHPDNQQETYVGEIVSGRWDGTFWYLEPGWYERIGEWADPI